MALIEYTGIVNQIRGKLNGSVFNKAKGGFTVQSKQHPNQGLSPAQAQRRAMFSSVQRSWKTLTADQFSKASQSAVNNPTTDRFGNEVVLSGYNHWVKLNLIRSQIGLPLLEDILTHPALPVAFTLSPVNLVFDTDINGFSLLNIETVADVTIANTEDVVLLAYVSKPVSRGVGSYDSRWYFGAHLSFSSGAFAGPSLALNLLGDIRLDYFLPYPGQVVFVKFDIWAINSGALISSVVQRVFF